MKTNTQHRSYKSVYVVIVYILFFLLLAGCRTAWEYGFDLKNNANHSIGWYMSLCYPDVSLPESDKKVNNGENWWSISKYASLYSGGPAYLRTEYEVIHNLNPRDTISVFIFHSDTLNKYPWETIRDNYNILVRYDLSADDIHNMEKVPWGNFYAIPFPPSEDMKNVHMWPPYEEVIAKYKE